MGRNDSRNGPVICWYCREAKAIEAFNREHVLPESFGKFRDNFVLHHRVCKVCNSTFSKEIEPALANDSMEGIQRFRSRVAERKDRPRVLPNKRIEVLHRGEGARGNAFLRFDEAATDGRPVVRARPQLGFAHSEAGPFRWYLLHELPSREELRAQGYLGDELFIQTAGMSQEQANTEIEKLGYVAGVLQEFEPAPDGDTVPIFVTGTIDLTLKRAITKIAFNYMICHYPYISSMDQFDPIRRYVLKGEDPGYDPVELSQEQFIRGYDEDQQPIAHALTVMWQPGSRIVLAQVSLFMWVQYRVTLTRQPFLIAPVCVDKGHLFDPHNKRILEVSRHVPLDLQRMLPLVPFPDEG